MSRFNPYSDLVRQNSLRCQNLRLSFLSAIAVLLFLNPPAHAGSVNATLQVRARVVSSCRVSTGSLLSSANTAHGRFNCPANSAGAASSSAAVRDTAANYTLSDAPGTAGAVKILTIDF